MFVRLQARARGRRARARIPKIRESRLVLDKLLSQWGGSLSCAFYSSGSASTRSETSQVYGEVMASDRGCDGVRGSTRGGRGQSKAFKSVFFSADPARQHKANKNTLLTAAVHKNTKGTYFSAVKPWFKWRLSGLKDPYPYMGEWSTSKEKQAELLGFYTHYALTVGYSPSWLHTILHAIRHYHLLADVDLDLRIMLRLALVKKGWKRIYGSEKRKIAATVELLGEVYYNCSLPMDSWGDLVLITHHRHLGGFPFSLEVERLPA